MNAYHKKQIEAAFKAGKNVFSEKPLATTIKDCQSIFQKYLKSNCKFATGLEEIKTMTIFKSIIHQ